MHSNFWWDQCVWPQKGCRCQSINVAQIQRCRYVYVHMHMYDTACAYMHVHLYVNIYIYMCSFWKNEKILTHIGKTKRTANAENDALKNRHWINTNLRKNNTTKFKITWMFFEKNMWFQTDRIWFVKNTPSWRCAIMPSYCVQQQTVFFKPYTSRILMAKTKMPRRKT